MVEEIVINEAGNVVVSTEKSVSEYVQPILEKIEVEKQAIEQATSAHNIFVESHLRKIEEMKSKLSVLLNQ